MFGSTDSQQTTTMGPPAVQDPAMLDGVQPPAQPQQDTPPATTLSTPPAPAEPTPQLVEHPMTTDNPFIQNPIGDTTATTVASPQLELATPAPALTPAFPSDTATTAPTPPATDEPVLESEPVSEDDEPTAVTPALSPIEPVDTDHLASMKQEALGHLEPLVDHLDQSPEEEFHTLLTMIRANDNHSLLEKALSAAKNIPDDKARAEALLDIINEINYFSSQS